MGTGSSSLSEIATAYACSKQQLKYGDSNKPLLRALIRSCIGHLALTVHPDLNPEVQRAITQTVRFRLGFV